MDERAPVSSYAATTEGRDRAVHAHDLTMFTDDPPDADAIEAGAWDTPRYGRGDRRGSYHEVGPEAAARALAMLDLGRPVRSFSLGETLYAGYPGWGERAYSQRLVVNHAQPGSPNRASTLEEVVSLSFNLGSKVNGLAHAGVGRVYYGGRRIDDLVAAGCTLFVIASAITFARLLHGQLSG